MNHYAQYRLDLLRKVASYVKENRLPDDTIVTQELIDEVESEMLAEKAVPHSEGGLETLFGSDK